jgi:tetratricopeptide (TPR) repeat protein
MKKKNFYYAFNVVYELVKDGLGISQKEELYRLLFRNVYLLAGDDLYDNDTIRKVTAGNSTIHRKAVKVLCTDEGFETFRINIAEICLPKLSDRECLVSELQLLLNSDNVVPNNIKQCIANSVTDGSDYQISRAVAAVLVCLNHSDYICDKGRDSFIDVDFMRMTSDVPIPKYPKYISDTPDAAVEKLIGREDELEKMSIEIMDNEGKLMISAVGGLGKTELVKLFLNQIIDIESKISGIEMIAWIPYNNRDIRLAIKQALHLQCDLDKVWLTIQNMALEYNKRLLLVVDNIENAESDEYLRKLSSLKCRILVTSRQKSLMGFSKVMYLQPLKIDKCRDLFYLHYQFTERDNEVVNDIICLTAKLTIMIVFIAKVAYLEGMSLHEIYAKLVEKGFKLSDEDVSCEHEKLQSDKTIIQQMCILFSIVSYSNDDKILLTYISVIPNLQFDFSKAKKWFKTKKNSSLMKLFNMGMLEHTTKKRTHVYWMHSVIASAIREQQKDKLYDLSRPFIDILSEELNTGPAFGREYKKAYLIPFSWSVADIMENHWNDENDADFLTNLFHVCFACSNYALCEKLIDVVIKVQKDGSKFTYMNLAYSYRNKIDLLLQFDRVAEASVVFGKVEELFDENNASEDDRMIMNSQYGILYQIRGDYKKSRTYFDKCIKKAEVSDEETRMKDISTACTNMARMLVDSGDFFEAYKYVKRAIEVQGNDDTDADLIICYSTLGSICTELVNAGHGMHFVQEAMDSFKKVIDFREKYLGKHHADTAVAYHEYAYFLYVNQQYDEALRYNEKAYSIEEELFSEYSITRMRSLNTKALIIWEQGKYQEADDIFDYIIGISEKMSDDYLVDVADFEFNYARCLHDQNEDEKAMEVYDKCIAIWSDMSDDGNPKLAMAYQELADILFSRGEIIIALNDYQKAAEYITEDFYMMVDVIDRIAACLLMSQQVEDGIQTFKKLLNMLVEYNATDTETKFQICNNLFCLLDAESDDELEWRKMLIEQIKDDSAVMEYVNNFFINIGEK